MVRLMQSWWKMERLAPPVPQTEAGLSKQLKNKIRTHDRIEMQTLMCSSMSLRFLKWNCSCCSNYSRSSGAPWRFRSAVLWLLGCERVLEQQLRGGLCDSKWQSEMCVMSFFMHKSHIYLWKFSLQDQISMTDRKMNATVKSVVFLLFLFIF